MKSRFILSDERVRELEKGFSGDGSPFSYHAMKTRAAIAAQTSKPCPECENGVAPRGGNEGTTRYTCPACNGTGKSKGASDGG